MFALSIALSVHAEHPRFGRSSHGFLDELSQDTFCLLHGDDVMRTMQIVTKISISRIEIRYDTSSMHMRIELIMQVTP